MASYVIARVIRSNLLYLYFTLGIMIPIHTILLPSLLLTKTFNLINTRLSLILVYIAFRLSISIFILVGFMKSIPGEFEEVAFIDGASRVRTFFRVIFPLSRPAIATVGLLATIENWNAYLMPLVIITAKELKVITQGLQELKSLYWTDYGLMSAGLVISFIPMVLIYILFQEQVIAGLTAGGLKG
jgi:raffinose/stachyose/melibiose transport system permease protein